MRALRGLTVFTFAGLALACTGSGQEDSALDSEEQEAPPARLLLVMDNSSSMADEAGGLAALADQLMVEGVTVGITTTSVEDPGNSPPGLAGALVGDPTTDAEEFQRQLLCEATCWQSSSVPSEPAYTCGDPWEQVTLQLLDCACGFEAWEGSCGSGDEEHLEAALLGACRSVEPMPEACLEQSPLDGSEAGSGVLVAGQNNLVVVVSDEGDGSRRLAQGEDDPAVYLSLYEDLGLDLTFAVLGPNYDPSAGTLECNSGGATTWGSQRLREVSEVTGGFYAPIGVTGGSGCEQGDLQGFVAEVVALF